MPEPVRADPHGRPSQRTSTIVPAATASPAKKINCLELLAGFAWRAALRVFELSYGKPAETVEVDLDVVDPLHVAEMTSAERALLVARVLEQHPHLAELVPLRLRTVPEVEDGHPLKAE